MFCMKISLVLLIYYINTSLVRSDKLRIVGGYTVDIEHRPFQVSLQKVYSETNFEHICGGSIIRPNKILTAAHCVTNIKPNQYIFAVAAGITKLTEFPEQLIKVKKIILYENYDTNTLLNDIAILSLEHSFTYNLNIKPIAIAKVKPSVNTICTVSGWGATMENGTVSMNLKAVKVPILSQAECKLMFSPTVITDNNFCAGYRKGVRDSCEGDSGGPLTANNQLIGIVSWGTGCARAGKPGVYTNVVRFIPWINQHLS